MDAFRVMEFPEFRIQLASEWANDVASLALLGMKGVNLNIHYHELLVRLFAIFDPVLAESLVAGYGSTSPSVFGDFIITIEAAGLTKEHFMQNVAHAMRVLTSTK